MPMAMKFSDFKKLSDDELEKKYDETVPNTVVGLSFFWEEIQRRERNKLTRATIKLTIVIIILAIVQAVAVVANLFPNLFAK